MARWQRAERLLPPGGLVLDLGCAFGYGTAMVARRHQVIGVDASPAFIARARRRYPHLRFEQAPAEALPFADATFGAVLLLDVLEHVRREQPVLQEVARVLRPGGTVVLSVPNKGALRWLDSLNVWDHLAGGGSHPPEEVIPGGYPYHRHYAEADLAGLLAPWFSISAVQYTGLGLVRIHQSGRLGPGQRPGHSAARPSTTV